MSLKVICCEKCRLSSTERVDFCFGLFAALILMNFTQRLHERPGEEEEEEEYIIPEPVKDEESGEMAKYLMGPVPAGKPKDAVAETAKKYSYQLAVVSVAHESYSRHRTSFDCWLIWNDGNLQRTPEIGCSLFRAPGSWHTLFMHFDFDPLCLPLASSRWSSLALMCCGDVLYYVIPSAGHLHACSSGKLLLLLGHHAHTRRPPSSYPSRWIMHSPRACKIQEDSMHRDAFDGT
eukprot:33642-Prorocentrum_minimum.AAC.2